MERAKQIEVGDVFDTNRHGKCVVLEYSGCTNVLVEFLATGFISSFSARSIREGVLRDPTALRPCGFGYLGVGDYSSNGNKSTYDIWSNILSRCYNPNQKFYHRYGGRGITVAREWHNFQVFCKWYEENSVDGFNLDKDLRVEGSKVYSPRTCEFIPSNINSLLLSSPENRGALPVGVSYDRGAYRARLNRGSERDKRLGRFKTPELAFLTYKRAKEDYIKEIAQEHFDKGDISEQVYNTLMTWEIVPFPE